MHKNNKKNILHIAPHLGGGVGTVLLNYLSFVKDTKNTIHLIATLDYANERSIKQSQEVGFKLFSNMHKKVFDLLDLISEADIILIHFWNHPLLYDFLVRNELPPARIIFWSHVSGFVPPYIFPLKTLKYPDVFVFTTPLSFEVKEVENIPDKNRFRTIWSTGGVNNVKNAIKKSHKGFNIGYIGTVDYSKMHPEFLEICSQINIPDVKFIICASDNYVNIQTHAQKMGIANKFEFLCQVPNIKDYLEIFDVFGYPLNPNHYGTCDQVLQEAMAVGVAPVVLNNPMESYMVSNGKVGLVAKNTKEYIDLIEKLYNEPALRAELSKNAKEYAISKYSVEILNEEWEQIFKDVLNSPKIRRKWDISKQNITYMDIFIESIGEYGINFGKKNIEEIKKMAKLPNWQSETKGTIHQYYKFFKEDKNIKYFSELMKCSDPQNILQP